MIANCGMPWYLLYPLVATVFMAALGMLILVIQIVRDP